MNIKRILKSWQHYEEQKSLFDKIEQTVLQKMCNSLEACKIEGCVVEDNLQHMEDHTYVMKGAVTGSIPIRPEGNRIVFPLPSYRYCHAQSYFDELNENKIHRWDAVTYIPRVWKWSYIIEIGLTPSGVKHIKELDILERDEYLRIKELNDRLFSETQATACSAFIVGGLADFARFLEDIKKP